MIAADAPDLPDGARMVMRCDRLGCAQIVDVDVHCIATPTLDALVATLITALAQQLGWLVERDGAITFCPACNAARVAARTSKKRAP